MANSVANFIPEVWSPKIQKILDENSVMLKVVNRDYEGEIKNAGDTVKVRTFGDITINDYTRNSTLTFEDLADPLSTMSIDQQKDFAFKLDDLDKAQADVKILEGYVKRAAEGIRKVIDKRLHSHYADVPTANTIGTSGSPITLTEDNIYGYICDLAEKLDSANAPEDGRHLIIDPKRKNLLRKCDEFTHATAKGDQVIQNGMIGEIAGFAVHCSTNLNAVTSNVPLLGLTKDFISYASQVSKVEYVRPSNMFADAVKGLYLYGSKVFTNTSSGRGVDNCGAALWAAGV